MALFFKVNLSPLFGMIYNVEYVFAAYGIAFGLIGGYLVSLVLRHRRIRRDLNQLKP